MIKQLQRFDFGTLRDFRGPIVMMPETAPEPEAVEPPPPPPPPSFSEDELAQARMEAKKLGYAEGFTAGMAQAAAEADLHAQQAQTAIGQVAAQLNGMDQVYAEVLKTQSMEVSELALLIARKVAAEAMDARSVDVIAALVMRCLPVIFSRPRITIELNPATLEKAQAHLNEQLAQHHYEGEVQYRANPSLGAADARIDWGQGMAERSASTIWQEIEALLARVPMAMEIPQSVITPNEPPQE